jgi:hypothetical protein
MATHENHNTTTVIIINHKENPFPITHAKIHKIATIPPNQNPSGPPQVPHAITTNIHELYNIKIKIYPHEDPPSKKK